MACKVSKFNQNLMFEKRSLKRAQAVAHEHLQAAGFNPDDHTDVDAMVKAYNEEISGAQPRFRLIPANEPAPMQGTCSDSASGESESLSEQESPMDIEAGDNTEFANTDKAETIMEHAASNEDAASALHHHAQDTATATDATMASTQTTQNPCSMFDIDVEPKADGPRGLCHRSQM